jgi:hypothetical protein
MALERFSNNAETTLNGSMNNTSNPVTFNVTDGSVFPSSGNFRLLIEDEILLATSRSGNSVTASRAQESTTIASHADLTSVKQVLSAAGFSQMLADFVTTGTLASKPASLRKGHIYLTSDSCVLYYDDGSNLIPYGPIYKFYEPDNSLYSWVNQSSSTLTTTQGGLLLEKAVQDTSKWSLRRKATPSAPYTVDIAFTINAHPTSGAWRVAFGWRESSSGKLHLLEFQATTLYTGLGINSAKWTDETTFSANYQADDGTNTSIDVPPLFVRLKDDNTNRIVSLSFDGIDYIDVHSIGRTDFITPDQLVFGIRHGGNNTQNVGVLIHSWQEH